MDLFNSLCEVLGWQGGTAHQVVGEVMLLKRRANEYKRMQFALENILFHLGNAKDGYEESLDSAIEYTEFMKGLIKKDFE